MGFFDQIFGEDTETKEKAGKALGVVFGKAEGGMMYRLLTGFTNLLANLGGMFDNGRNERQFNERVDERMGEQITVTARNELFMHLHKNNIDIEELSPAQQALVTATFNKAMEIGREMKAELIADGNYSREDARKVKEKTQEVAREGFSRWG